MPFTVSHIAAVLPAYRPLSRAHLFTAAVIGSMVPDFGFLLREWPTRLETHSIPALFTFCLPVGLATYLITLQLVKPALMAVVPDGAWVRLRAADAGARPLRAPSLLLAALTLLGGAVTHLVWDAFTHENARGVRMFPVLEEPGPSIAGWSIHLFRWLQYGSSIFGLIVLIIALGVWLRHARAPAARPARPLSAAERAVWFVLYSAVPPLMSLAALLRPPAPGELHRYLGTYIDISAISLMRGIVASLVLVSALIRLRLWLKARSAPE